MWPHKCKQKNCVYVYVHTAKHFTIYVVKMTVPFGFVTTYLMLYTKL